MLVEGQALGGTCLNIGCIPSKALIHVAEQFHQTQHHSQHSALGISVAAPTLDIGKSVEWKDGIVDRLTTGVAALLKKHKVQVIHGWAKVIGKTVEVGDQRIQCEHLVLATGSKSVNLPMLPMGGPIISSTEALAPTLPKRLVVVGGGYIGLELGIAYRKLGAEVSVVEARSASCRPTTPS
jgi:dihydrolipoamide dehydrogenase